MSFSIKSLNPGALIQTGVLGTWLDLSHEPGSICMKEKTIFFVISSKEYIESSKNNRYRELYVYAHHYEKYGVVTVFNDALDMICDWIEIK